MSSSDFLPINRREQKIRPDIIADKWKMTKLKWSLKWNSCMYMTTSYNRQCDNTMHCRLENKEVVYNTRKKINRFHGLNTTVCKNGYYRYNFTVGISVCSWCKWMLPIWYSRYLHVLQFTPVDHEKSFSIATKGAGCCILKYLKDPLQPHFLITSIFFYCFLLAHWGGHTSPPFPVKKLQDRKAHTKKKKLSPFPCNFPSPPALTFYQRGNW